MRNPIHLAWLVAGLMVGVLAGGLYFGQTKPAFAANDRFEDFVICTGPVGTNHKVPTDGVWLLDYRSGKLLGSVIDREAGRVVGWSELDLVKEFGIVPRQNVHFLMTTGNIALGQSALYVAETTTGKFGIYTMGSRTDNQPGIQIHRQDLSTFRAAKPN